MSERLSLAKLQKDLELFKDETTKNFQSTNKRVDGVEGRVSKAEARLNALEKKKEELVDQLNDIKRQNCKVCVVLGGEDLPARTEGENPKMIFCESIARKYGLRVDSEVDLVTVHRRPKGDLIGKFGKTAPGSNFHQLAHRRGKGNRNPKPELRIYANVLLSSFDNRVRYYASLAKKCGVIHFFETLPSGKIMVLIDDDKKPGEKKMIPITNARDVKLLLTEEVIRMIKIRPIKNKETRVQTEASGGQDDVEMDEVALLYPSQQQPN